MGPEAGRQGVTSEGLQVNFDHSECGHQAFPVAHFRHRTQPEVSAAFDYVPGGRFPCAIGRRRLQLQLPLLCQAFRVPSASQSDR